MPELRFRNQVFEALPVKLDFTFSAYLRYDISTPVTKNQKNSSRIRILGSNGLK